MAKRRPIEPLSIRCGHWIENDGIVLSIKQRGEPGSHRHLRMVPTWEEYEVGQMLNYDDLMWLSVEEAQVLMDQLYQCGLRPTESHGSPGQIAAMKDHIEDLRHVMRTCLPEGGRR